MIKDQFRVHGDIWEVNAKSNAKWAVISDPARLESGWSAKDFLASGEADIQAVFGKLHRLGIVVNTEGRALDFGSGVGRLTQALAKRFRHVTGLDVSPEMVRQAQDLARGNALESVEFRVNSSPDLSSIKSQSLSFILSLIVIQHIPPPYSSHYLKEFARTLARGGILYVQVPTRRTASWKNWVRLVVPEQAFRLKHKLLKSKVPYVTMFGILERDLVALLQKEGLTLLNAEADTLAGHDWESRTYVFTRV